MKKSIARKILLVTSIALLTFALAIFFVINSINRQTAIDNSTKLLAVMEKQLQDSGYVSEEQFEKQCKEFVKTSLEDLRITIIKLDGTVLADSVLEDVSAMEDHSKRPEVEGALKGETASSIRKSDTFRINYIYTAKKINVNGAKIILRVAVPVNSINQYLGVILLAMLLILLAVLVIALFISSLIAKTVNKPLMLIKEKLDSVDGSHDRKQIELTKFDEVNTVLEEIDELSEKLNFNLGKYFSEKQKLDFIIQNTNQGIITLNKEMEILLYNKIAAAYFNKLEINEKINKFIRDVSFNENLNKCAESGNYINFDLNLKNGKILEIRFTPIWDSDIFVIIVINDVTDIRKLGIEKQEFFVNASHELNTPLASILGYSEMMLSSGKLEKKFLETINKEALRMKLLISDMLQISELESQKIIEDSKIDIKKIAEDVIVSCQPMAAAKNVILRNQLKKGIIFANSEKMTKLISNLVDNSIKYNNDGGFVEIISDTKDDNVILTVKDNGIGIPQKDLNRIFERFYRIDKDRHKKERGTGLGLAIVKHIALHYDARIDINSKENEGTEITITFKKI